MEEFDQMQDDAFLEAHEPLEPPEQVPAEQIMSEAPPAWWHHARGDIESKMEQS